jgi:hypothetical protein
VRRDVAGARPSRSGVRVALGGNLAFFRTLGYEVTGESRHDGYAYTTYLDLRKPLLPADG